MQKVSQLNDMGVGLWCQTPILITFQLYRDGQSYWRMVEETGVPGKNYRTATSH